MCTTRSNLFVRVAVVVMFPVRAYLYRAVEAAVPHGVNVVIC